MGISRAVRLSALLTGLSLMALSVHAEELPTSSLNTCEALSSSYLKTIGGDGEILDPNQIDGSPLEAAKKSAIEVCARNSGCPDSAESKQLCEALPGCRYTVESPPPTESPCVPTHCTLEICEGNGWCLSAIVLYDRDGNGREANRGELKALAPLGYRIEENLKRFLDPKFTYTHHSFKPTLEPGSSISCVAQGVITCRDRCVPDDSKPDFSALF